LYIYITHLCQITSLSFTDERCVDQIDERNRFPIQIYLSHYRGHPIICVPQLPGIVWPRANLWFSHSIDKHMMYVLCFNLFNCLFGSQVYWFIQYNTFLYEMQYSCPFLIVPSFGSYHYFPDSGLVLTGNYWSHGFLLQSGNHHSESFAMASASLLTAYGLSVSQMTTYIFRLSFRSTWVFSCLSGVRVVHVVNLYDVISCNVSYDICVKTMFESSRLPILL
jgi:hypothetical protein